MSYRVRLSVAAEADYEERVLAMADRAPATARKLLASYLRGLTRLREHPLACGLAYENPQFDEEVRHLLFWAHPRRKYRALFTVPGDEVVILAIRAPGEEPVEPGDLAD